MSLTCLSDRPPAQSTRLVQMPCHGHRSFHMALYLSILIMITVLFNKKNGLGNISSLKLKGKMDRGLGTVLHNGHISFIS